MGRQMKVLRTTSLRLNKLCAPFLFAAVLSITGCASAEREQAKQQEAPPNLNALVTQPQPGSTVLPSTQPPPKPQEVQDAVKRVFKEAALIDTTRQANFVVGDFNGDQS